MKTNRFSRIFRLPPDLSSTATGSHILAVLVMCLFMSGCYLEGGGCSGPVCFSVGGDLCNGRDFCDEDAPGRCPDADDIQRIALAEINRIRSTTTQCGGVTYPVAGSVEWSADFFRAADSHALDMAGNSFVAEIGSDGLGVGDRVDGSVTYVAQSVAGGFGDAGVLIDEWVKLPQECTKMIDTRAAAIGLACRYDGDSAFGQYWALVSGRP